MATSSAPRGFVPPGQATFVPPGAAKPREKRVTLEGVVTGRTVMPPRLVIYGTEGAGKTSLGAETPNPIFLGVEDGTGLIDVPRFHLPDDVRLDDLRDAVAELTEKPHDRKTLVIDSLDWIEPIVWADLCRDEKVDSIEKVGKGYGKGYKAAYERQRAFLQDIERLRVKRGMMIVALAHAQVKTFLNPAGDDYDRYSPKLHKDPNAMWCEWADLVGFLDQETLVIEDDDSKRTKGIATGKRILNVVHAGGWYAKNRYNMPPAILMERGRMWEAIDAAMRAGIRKDPLALTALIIAACSIAGEEARQEITAGIEWAGKDPVRLEQVLQRANALNEAAAEAALKKETGSDAGE